MTGRGFAFLVGIWAISFASVARAELRALLVGVSDYDNSIGIADLKGPRNDVALLADILTARGATDLAVLADGVAGAGRPTRAAILDALAGLAGRAGPGDLVYVHLSGHGTRQADPEGDETDGMDEVFLPADTGRAEPGSNLIPNALVDDELGGAVRAIRQTGADVWLVMDSCHSGSGLRAAPAATAPRFVDPALLGVARVTAPRAEARIVETDGPEPPGGLLAFYSAQSSEVAREVGFDDGAGGTVWYGLFTAKLAARLQGGGALSYRQLFQAVMGDMNDSTVPGGARLQTPLWDGTMIDAAVLGGSDTTGLQRFAVKGGQVMAGKVHGLEDGTLLGLVVDAAAPADALIGHAQMQRTGATEAKLIAVAPDCVPRAATACPGLGAVPNGARFAQVLARPVDQVLRLAPPRDIATGQTLPPDNPARAALDAALAHLDAGNGAPIALDPAGYTVELYFADGQFWFGPRAVIGSSPVGLAVPPERDALVAALVRIGRAEDLARLLGTVATKPSLLSPSPVAVSIESRIVDAADLEPVGTAIDPYAECESAIAASRNAPAALTSGADLKQCDQLVVSARGSVAGARDVNRIHIDARFCVHAAHERIEGSAAPRQVGDGMVICSDCPDGYSAGQERMFVMITEAEPNTEPLNLTGLVETCGASAGATRGTETAQLIGFLTSLAERPGTRGSFGARAPTNVWVERHDWQVLPRPEAFLRAGRDPAK